MKILSCITNPIEVLYLKKVGADEIYFAVSWSPNYANNGSIKSFDELKEIIKICKKNNIKYHLAVNDFRCISDKEDYSLLKKTIKCGIDSLIVSDLGFGKYLTNNFRNISMHVSSLVSVMNVATLEFLYRYFDSS